ncbi:MAG: alpha/beta fold hydrolase [Nitrospira sp.]|nr:alpha/beta fold hydrolase [Nitrospira sp.]
MDGRTAQGGKIDILMLTVSRVSPWIVTPRPVSSGTRLICFPYAGAGASVFRGWADSEFLADIEVCAVQLPGREARITESSVGDLRQLVSLLREALKPYMDRPCAFFGHSIGALVSFELARELRRSDGIEPSHLFVSGGPAPHLPCSERMCDLSEDEFLERLHRFNGTPPEVLNHPELMHMMLPVLRADFSLRDLYVYREEPPLSCPITTFGGMSDTHVDSLMLRAWQQHTRERFQLWLFQGDHFFMRSAQGPLLEVLSTALSPYREVAR